MMTESNLSKIKPKLRTEGRVSGNFGRNKVRTNGNTNLGLTDAEVINITTQDEYLQRMITAYHNTQDSKLKSFCYNEIKRIKQQRGEW